MIAGPSPSPSPAPRSRSAGRLHWIWPQGRQQPGWVAMSLITGGCGLLYALYRGYYGFGGTVGMIGRPVSPAEWRLINLVGAVMLLVAALLPVAAIPLWRRPRWRRALLGLCWVMAVGYVMHAVIDDTQRVLDLTGAVQMHYSAFWATVNIHAADIQDLAFNETWFLAEGLLWGAVALKVLGPSPARRWWAGTALAGIAVLTSEGLLSALAHIGKIVIF
jgi:hypothetical protein